MMELPFVTVIIPCRNEANFISACLESVVANDYPRDRLEVLVMDGMSEDGTREIVEAFMKDCPFVRCIDNPKRTTPCGLNIGIKNARGELIIWMSAHNQYSPDYIRLSVEGLLTHDADNVGGVIVTVPRNPTRIGKGIANALAHPFGVGNSYFRTRPTGPRWVDTVFGGCYRKSVFDRIGLFNEQLTRGQDVELNIRLRKSGGRILLLPNIVSYYYARTEWRSFLKYNWSNGLWAILPFRYSKNIPVSWRHLTPLAFVLTTLVSAALASFYAAAAWLLASVLGTYFIVSLAASAQIAFKEKKLSFLFMMPLIFGGLHFSYGLGSLYGLIKVMSCMTAATPKES